jgi:long-chain-fatty-acid--CoA ligase ACSBG
VGKDGHPIPGVKIKINNPDFDGVGEICIRGRNVFMGYLKRDKENYETFDVEGYFHTGDIGYIDKETGDRLVVTGRLKDIIVTAGGENISPSPIEELLKSLCPIISYCVLIGDDRPYLTLLITLKVKVDAHAKPTFELDPSVRSHLFRQFGVNEEVQTIEKAKRSRMVKEYI